MCFTATLSVSAQITAVVTLPEASEQPEIIAEAQNPRPWRVIVWDDPVNTMQYVSYVFRSYFGFSDDKAHQLMLQVHTKGSAVVSEGTREKAETDVMAMHSYGLQASVSQGDHG